LNGLFKLCTDALFGLVVYHEISLPDCCQPPSWPASSVWAVLEMLCQIFTIYLDILSIFTQNRFVSLFSWCILFCNVSFVIFCLMLRAHRWTWKVLSGSQNLMYSALIWLFLHFKSNFF
jgi:hypothetical protein